MTSALVIPINTGSFFRLQILSPVLNLKAYPKSADLQPWRATEVGGWSLNHCLVWRVSGKEVSGGRSGHVFMKWVKAGVGEVPWGLLCNFFLFYATW